MSWRDFAQLIENNDADPQHWASAIEHNPNDPVTALMVATQGASLRNLCQIVTTLATVATIATSDEDEEEGDDTDERQHCEICGDTDHNAAQCPYQSPLPSSPATILAHWFGDARIYTREEWALRQEVQEMPDDQLAFLAGEEVKPEIQDIVTERLSTYKQGPDGVYRPE